MLVLLLWAGYPVALTKAQGDDIFGEDAAKEFRALSEAHQYRKLRGQLAAIEPKLSGTSAELRAEFEALKKDLTRARERWLTESVSKWMYEDLQSGIRLKVANVKLSAEKTLAWARARLADETLASSVKRVKPLDDVAVTQVLAAWNRRKKGKWRRLAIPRGTTRDNILTNEGWWEAATLAERRERVLLVFVTEGGLFEIRRKPYWSACPICNGTGLLRKRLTDGETLSYLCTNCRGAQRFAALGYR